MTDFADSHAVAEDKPKLKPANENPWYILATLHGEQPEGADFLNYDRSLHAKNRRTWNKWAFAAFTNDQLEFLRNRVDKEGNPTFSSEELTPNNGFDRAEFKKLWSQRINCFGGTNIEIPNPDTYKDFVNNCFNKYFNVEGLIFFGDGRFDYAVFEKGANFNDVVFFHSADFNSAKFLLQSKFCNVVIHQHAGFSKVKFSKDVEFNDAIFKYIADFNYAIFRNTVYFENVKFKFSMFGNVIFFGEFNFSNTKFDEMASFTYSRFNKRAVFDNAIFSNDCSFSMVKFKNDVEFQSVNFKKSFFNNSIFSGRADFTNAQFLSCTNFSKSDFKKFPPKFHGASLHEGTVWHGATWPDPPSDKKIAQQHVYNYERLKQEMERLKKHEDELEFFALEMRAKRVVEGKWSGKRWINAAYEWFSDYGRSVLRPAYGLAATLLLGAVPIALWMGWGREDWFWFPKLKNALGLSLANILSLIGIRKDFFDADWLLILPAWIKVLSGTQTLLGLLFAFLIGLALRNRFRLK